MCKTAIEMENIDTGVIEHMLIILCIATKYIPKNTLTVFEELLKTDYSNYVAFFMIDMLQELSIVEIKTRLVYQEEQFEEYSYKLINGSTSITAQEYLTQLSQRLYIDDTKSQEYIENAKNRLGSGAVYLIGVTSYIKLIESISSSKD
jgi:hypothetical protein